MIDRKGTLSLCSALTIAAVVGVAAPALAQEAAPAASEPPPATQHRSSSGSNAGALGVGGTAFLSGLAGANVVYDMGAFHLEGLLGFVRQPVGMTNATTWNVGVGGWYHLAMGDNSDFSLGGTVGFAHYTLGEGDTDFRVEPGAMIRAFVTSNVAVHARLGLAFVFNENSDMFMLGSDVVGGFGATYFFK
jgi:hypothetical protein